MSGQEDRDRLLSVIAEGFAPSRWHPIKRRKWRRFSAVVFASPRSLAHWSQSPESDLFFAEQVKPLADAVCAEMSGRLPDGFSFHWAPPSGFSPREDSPIDLGLDRE